MTSFFAIREDMIHAGANCVDQEVVEGCTVGVDSFPSLLYGRNGGRDKTVVFITREPGGLLPWEGVGVIRFFPGDDAC